MAKSRRADWTRKQVQPKMRKVSCSVRKPKDNFGLSTVAKKRSVKKKLVFRQNS